MMWAFPSNHSVTGILIYTLVPILVYFLLPKYLRQITKKEAKHKELLLLAASLFAISQFLPSPLIHGSNTQFMTHFIGGGIFTGLVWLFIKKNLGLTLSPLAELASLYFLVSGLGAANELFEFFANGIGLAVIPSFDTWWDLLANTLGALVFWVGYKALSK
jgi:hypothetical protein